MRQAYQVSSVAVRILSVLLTAGSCSAMQPITGARDASGYRDSALPEDLVDASVDIADTQGQDASDARSSFALEFPERVRTTIRDAGTASTCVSPLPSLSAATSDDARTVLRQFIAGVRRVSPDELVVTDALCSSNGTQGCARTFQHDIYKSNGIYGESLFPLAQELETTAASVAETTWVATVNGIAMAADVAITGVVDGTIVGMVMFNDRQDCP